MGIQDVINSIFGKRSQSKPTSSEIAARNAERARREKEAEDQRIRKAWSNFELMHSNKTVISAAANRTIKRPNHEAELLFDLNGVKAYMPISHISTGYIKDIEEFVGKKLDFRILTVHPADHSVIVSAKIVQAEEQLKKKEEAKLLLQREKEEYRKELEELTKRNYVEVIVESIESRGASVRLKDTCAGKTVTSWIHISQLADKYVSHPTEVLKIGDEVRACAKLGSIGTELELSIKEFIVKEKQKRKEEVFSCLEEGAVVTGSVTNIRSKTVFVDLGGVEGSIFVSELSKSYVRDPHDLLRVGEEVEAVVLRIDEENERIELSLKKLQEIRAMEHKASDDYRNVNNTKLIFEGPVCLRLNDSRDPKEKNLNRLKDSEVYLQRAFSHIADIASENKLETILRSTFPDGLKSRVYIRNLTFEGADGTDKSTLGIRPELTPGCYLSSILRPGASLLFKGRVRGKEFIVDSVHDMADTEQLEYEATCVVTTFRNPQRVDSNFLFDVLDQTASITKHTSSCLTEWEVYLKWKKTIAQQQIAGCKYYDVTYDGSKKNLIFDVITESKESFQAFKRHLRSKDIRAFSDSYSSAKWNFEFSEERGKQKRKGRGVNLGKYVGILNQGYLDDLPDGYKITLTSDDEKSVRTSFKTPYIAQVAFELNDDDIDDVEGQDLESDEESAYIWENLLSNYHSQGFLALSAAGQFALISRFERAISGLRNDQSKSPNLALWLFDARRARTPKLEISDDIEDWLNPGIARNENQRVAVLKMLNAPDLGLIQGPPGTGKTTVIAEIIYQLAKKGNRVLVTSQSNDAVDNALDRLVETPQIKAIRLGQKNRRKLHLDGYAPHKFSEDEALRSYYTALSRSISDSWLDGWDLLDARVPEFEVDIRDAKYFREDIVSLQQKNRELETSLSELLILLSEQNASLDKAQRTADTREHERRQIPLLKRMLSGAIKEGLYLSERQLRTVVPVIEGCLNEALESGLLIIPTPLDADLQSERALNASIEIACSSVNVLRTLPDKLLSTKREGYSAELQILERKQADTRTDLLSAIDIEDEEVERACRDSLKRIKLEIDKLKNASDTVLLESLEKSLISDEILSHFDEITIETTRQAILDFLQKWDEAVSSALALLEESPAEETTTDPLGILESIKSTKGKIESVERKIAECKEEISQKEGVLTELAYKYSSVSEDPGDVIEKIESTRSEHMKALEEQALMRETWEHVIRGFKDRLEEEGTHDFENDYFKRIYINSCNVVGISCTDDMRNLDDNGFESFDVVIVDEVSKATPPEILIPLMKARKAILVGDHRQLPPMFDEHEKSYSELINDPESIPEDLSSLLTGENFTRFKKMVTSSLFKEHFEAADESIKHSLLVQYRMHSDIMDIINRFYDGRLSAGMSSDEEEQARKHGLSLRGIDGGTLFTPENHAYWIDTSSLPDGTPIYESFPGRSTSACNYLEIESILELLMRLASEYANMGFGKGNKKSVGVISFYQTQVNELRRRFKSLRKKFDFSALDVDINTVDRFQGKEKNIIIVSLVRNNQQARASKHVVAFERINVAFSRAQEMLVIVGASHMYDGLKVELPDMDTGEVGKIPVYKYILDDLNFKGCLRNSNQLINDEKAKRVLADFEKNRGEK